SIPGKHIYRQGSRSYLWRQMTGLTFVPMPGTCCVYLLAVGESGNINPGTLYANQLLLVRHAGNRFPREDVISYDRNAQFQLLGNQFLKEAGGMSHALAFIEQVIKRHTTGINTDDIA